MRDKKSLAAIGALLVAPIAAGSSVIVASGVASLDAIITMVAAAVTISSTWWAQRRNRSTRDDNRDI
ncbi:hypothetical protein [Streptomyces sp. NPDC057677]|uniref:hypothetical protein n=1 Tax=unclassified Streptomyces TaxID=2593676 RepID=UPI0036B24183